jgi:UDP-N-acetylglucosamine--N-acetylmuramyl-(pentapeptide) pyrophosphoryl-undecaprenol N-acetylglucosamine transferase
MRQHTKEGTRQRNGPGDIGEKRLRVALAGGGTGGHVYPAIAIGQAIIRERPDTDLLYVGTEGGLEKDVVPREGFAFVTVSSGGIAGKSLIQAGKNAFLAFTGVLKSLTILRRFRPHVVIGTGGYVSGPVVLAAYLLRIPVLLQEQNVIPGATTRYLSRLASEVAIPFPEARQYMPEGVKCFVSGNPVRIGLVNTVRQKASGSLGLDPGKKTLLVMGGSRGAKKIVEAGCYLVGLFAEQPRFQMIFITGKEYYGQVLRNLEEEGILGGKAYDTTEERISPIQNVLVAAYMHDIENALAASDLAVARAGAMTVSELLDCAVPSILIPSPNVVRNHQEYNARAVERRGAGIVMLEKHLSSERLCKVVIDLFEDESRLSKMAQAARVAANPKAAQNIASRAISLANQG